jgi:tRNA A-37 threonylcarbamoyl transferase component Bud32
VETLDIARIRRAHEEGKGTSLQILDSPRSAATRIVCDWMPESIHVFVKEEKRARLARRLAALLLGNRTRKAWRAACSMGVRGIPTPEALAFVEKSRWGGGNLLITRFVADAVSLSVFASSKPVPADRKAVAEAAAATAGSLHRWGLYHCDWSAKNFLVAREPGDRHFSVLVADAEALEGRSSLTRARIIKNLGQLNDVGGFTNGDRMRFYRFYVRSCGAELSKKEMRAVVAFTMKRAARRFSGSGVQRF